MGNSDYWEAMGKAAEIKAGDALGISNILNFYLEKLNPEELNNILKIYIRNCRMKQIIERRVSQI